MATGEAAEMLRAQAAIWKYMFAFTDSMALTCAVDLRIADTINSHGRPMSLSQIAASIEGSSNSMEMMVSYLERIMRLLVRCKIFTTASSPSSGETLYGLTPLSKWLVRETEPNLVDMVMLQNHPLMLAPWSLHSQCVKEGGLAFKKANGAAIWDLALENQKFNQAFNDGMKCTAKIITQAIFGTYKDGFASINGSLVDVGGGTGGLIAEIVKAYPQTIRGINFDLPHVVATAPPREGVEHVGGNMRESVPPADAFFMKWVMHDQPDEQCIKILRNCKNSLKDKVNGKVIIVDFILKPEGDGMFDDMATIFDVLMLTNSSGGKERTEVEWKNILEEGGFPRFRIINIPAPASIIEAFPQ